MSKRVMVPDTVYERAEAIAEEKDMTMKEAVRLMCRSAEGFEV